MRPGPLEAPGRYKGINLNIWSVQAEGWQARILQHEVDHLHGVLYVDRALPDSVSPYEAPPTDLRAELGPCECSHPLK